VIDFCSVKKDTLEYEKHSPEFFNSPKRNYDRDGYVQFENMEERFKNEFYTVLRTF
jgi:hypothetical protein